MDALAHIQELKDAGFSEPQAKAVLRTVNKATDELVNKDYLSNKLENLELKLKLQMWAVALAILGGMVALQRLGVLL